MNNSLNIRSGKHSAAFWFVFGLLLFTCALPTFAQNTSNRGNFEVDVVSGCAPLTVTPNSLIPGSVVLYFYENRLDPLACAEDYQIRPELCTEGPLVGDGQFTYTTPGTYYIVQIVGNVSPQVDFIEINVVDPVAPSFETAVCGNNQIALTFDLASDNYDFYEIDFGDGTPIQTHNKADGNTVTYSYASQGTYDIQVSGSLTNGITTTCGAAPAVTVNTLQTVPTPEITFVTVIDASTLEISYAPLTNGLEYSLLLNENGVGAITVASIDPATNSQTFTYSSTSPGINFNFGQYGIQLSATDACATAENFSNIVQNIRAGFMANYDLGTPTLTRAWTTQDPESILSGVRLFYDGNPEVQALAVSGQSDLILSSCTDARPFYFEADFGNALSRSLTITPDLSTAPLSPPAPTGLGGQIASGALVLTYNAPAVPIGEYRIYLQTESGRQLEGSTTSETFSISNFSLSDTEVCYTVTYVDECGNESAPSEEACFQFTASIQIPNAFSPNGDGDNDTFSLRDGIFLDFRMEIYNRWGSLIFITNDANTGWNGLVNGSPAPMGGYVYRIQYNSGQNSPVSLTGSFTLIR